MQSADHQHFLSQNQRFLRGRVCVELTMGSALWITLWMERRFLEKLLYESFEMPVLVLGCYSSV